LGLYSAIYIGGHWSFVMISGQLARSQFCALRGVARCVCLAGRWIRWAADDCFKGTII